MPPHTPAVRRRDSTATRAALLAAAEELFAERGFDHSTVRDIAERAGVNQALLFRYFGSKGALFAEVMAQRSRQPLYAGPVEELPRRILRQIMDPETARTKDNPLYAILRSSAHGGEVSEVRRRLEEDYARALAALTDAPDAAERADLVLAWMLGLALLRNIFRKEPLADAEPDKVTSQVLGAIGGLLERADTGPR